MRRAAAQVTYGADSVKDCTRLGSFTATSGGGGWAHDAGYGKNERALKARTVRDGGDTLLIVKTYTTLGKSGRHYVYKSQGEAYRCGDRRPS